MTVCHNRTKPAGVRGLQTLSQWHVMTEARGICWKIYGITA